MCVYVLIIVQNWLQWLQRMYPWVCVCISRYFLLRFVPGARTLTEAETKSFISAADDDSDGRIGVQGWYLSSYLLFVILQACINKPFCCRGQNESILWAQIWKHTMCLSYIFYHLQVLFLQMIHSQFNLLFSPLEFQKMVLSWVLQTIGAQVFSPPSPGAFWSKLPFPCDLFLLNAVCANCFSNLI